MRGKNFELRATMLCFKFVAQSNTVLKLLRGCTAIVCSITDCPVACFVDDQEKSFAMVEVSRCMMFCSSGAPNPRAINVLVNIVTCAVLVTSTTTLRLSAAARTNESSDIATNSTTFSVSCAWKMRKDDGALLENLSKTSQEHTRMTTGCLYSFFKSSIFCSKYSKSARQSSGVIRQNATFVRPRQYMQCAAPSVLENANFSPLSRGSKSIIGLPLRLSATNNMANH